MIGGLPFYITLVFILTTIATLWLAYAALKQSGSVIVRKRAKLILAVLLAWLLLQAVLAAKHVYSAETNAMPPRILVFGIAPVLMAIVALFITESGRRFLDSLSLVRMAYINTVRIPVELVLWWLSLNGAVPQLMTFEGSNVDILAGVTAPLIGYFGFARLRLDRTWLLVWHLAGLALLLNIVVLAFLSAPSPLQQLAFDQPNIAILHFPFCWLPTFIVPVVLLGHLASIRQLFLQRRLAR